MRERHCFPCPVCRVPMKVGQTCALNIEGVSAVRRYRRCEKCQVSVRTMEVATNSSALNLTKKRMVQAAETKARAAKMVSDLATVVETGRS